MKRRYKVNATGGILHEAGQVGAPGQFIEVNEARAAELGPNLECDVEGSPVAFDDLGEKVIDAPPADKMFRRGRAQTKESDR